MMAFLLIALAAGLVLVAMIGSGGTKKPALGRRGHVDRDMVASRWATIQGMAASGPGLRNAVSEADKLLDYALKESGAPGQTMGDRLKAWGKHFSDIDGVWRAHKLRNALAHEVGFDLVKSQADEALRSFERGLKDLGAL